MASRAAASHVEASISSLSSDLLMRVANYLNSNKQLRAKYLSGAYALRTTSEWQEGYARWLTMRHVFVNSISLNGQTTAATQMLYDVMNRVNPGLVSLTIDGKVDFPQDMAVRNNKSLHVLTLSKQGKFGTEQLNDRANPQAPPVLGSCMHTACSAAPVDREIESTKTTSPECRSSVHGTRRPEEKLGPTRTEAWANPQAHGPAVDLYNYNVEE
ncbi:hypothetical protein B484DRAFT_402715 [Ochromonadaceae sp. CCMP2298]|nr:hypothetical protein B484DRAFT_402715 [Ochromonadaceae sp. CCMP2298]